jgi:hypothetical protein
MTKHFNEVSEEEVSAARAYVSKKIDLLDLTVQKIRKGDKSLKTQKIEILLITFLLIGIVVFLWVFREQALTPYLLLVFRTDIIHLLNPYQRLFLIKDSVFWVMYSFVIANFLVDIIACITHYIKLNKLIAKESKVLLIKSDYQNYLKNLDKNVNKAQRISESKTISNELTPFSEKYLKDIESSIDVFSGFNILKSILLLGGLLVNYIFHGYYFITYASPTIMYLLIIMSILLVVFKHKFVYFISPSIFILIFLLIF